MPPVSDLQLLLRTMEPVLNPGEFVFATVPPLASFDISAAVAFVREPEGLSVVMAESEAKKAGLVPEFRCAWITLSVHSDLQAVGFTAAFATALGRAGISCNVVAGTHHDHIFVPIELASAAMAELRSLQQNAAATATTNESAPEAL